MKKYNVTVAVDYATDKNFTAIKSENMSLKGITAHFKVEAYAETYSEACENVGEMLEKLDIQECEGLYLDNAMVEYNAEDAAAEWF